MFFMHLNQIQDEAHTSLKGKLKISNTKMLIRVTWMIIRLPLQSIGENVKTIQIVSAFFPSFKETLSKLKNWGVLSFDHRLTCVSLFKITLFVFVFLKKLRSKSWIHWYFVPLWGSWKSCPTIFACSWHEFLCVEQTDAYMQLLHIYHTPGNERYSLSVLLYIGLHWNWEHCMVILLLSASMDSTNFCWAGGLQCFFSCTLNKVNEITHLMHIFGQ